MQNAVYKSLLFTISLFTIGSLYAQGGDYIDGPNSGTCNSCFPSIANDPTTREFIDDNFPGSEEVLVRGYSGGPYYRWYKSGIYNTYYLDTSSGSSGSGSGNGGGGESGGGGNNSTSDPGSGDGGTNPDPCPGGITSSPDNSVVICHQN